MILGITLHKGVKGEFPIANGQYSTKSALFGGQTKFWEKLSTNKMNGIFINTIRLSEIACRNV